MIETNLSAIRQGAKIGSENVVITPRTNGLETGLFHGDVDGILNEQTAKLIDG